MLFNNLERQLEKLFGTEKVLVYEVLESNFLKWKDGKSTIELPFTGLLGISIKNNQIYDIKSASKSAYYNPLVDIETDENIRCFPVYYEPKEKIVIAAEFINKKGYMHIDKDIFYLLNDYISSKGWRF